MIVTNSDILSEVVISDMNGTSDSNHHDAHHHSITNGDAKSCSSPIATTNNIDHASPSQSSHLNCNPKKYGKFRILANNEELSSLSSETDLVHSETNHPRVVTGSDCDLTISNEMNISSTIVESTDAPKVRRRGRPKKNTTTTTTPTTKNVNTPPTNDSNFHNNGEIKVLSPANRRRSTRLRNLEEKKEPEDKPICSTLNPTETPNAVLHDTSTISDSSFMLEDSNNNFTRLSPIQIKCEESTTTENTEVTTPAMPAASKSDKKPIKSKAKMKANVKNDRTKKTKLKREPEKPPKSSKTNKENKDDKKADLLSHKVESPSENFSVPSLPISNTQVTENIASIVHSPCKSDSEDSAFRPEKVKSRWRRNSELDNITDITDIGSKTEMSQPMPNENHVLQNCTNEVCNESLPRFDMIGDNIFLFERYVLHL